VCAGIKNNNNNKKKQLTMVGGWCKWSFLQGFTFQSCQYISCEVSENKMHWENMFRGLSPYAGVASNKYLNILPLKRGYNIPQLSRLFYAALPKCSKWVQLN